MKKLWFFAVFFLLLPFYSQANINNRRIGVIYVTQQAGLTSSFVAYAYKKGGDKKLIKIDLSDNIAPCKVKATPASFKDKYIYQPVSFQTSFFGDICPYVLKDNVCYKPILIKATTQALNAAKTAFANRMNLIKTVLAYAQSKGYKAINVSFVFSCLINGQRRDIVDSVESFQLFQGGEFKPAVFSTGFYISNPDPVFIKIGYIMPVVDEAALQINPNIKQIAWNDGILGRLVIQAVTLSGLKKTLINTQIDLNASTAREALNDILQQYKDIIQEQQPIFIKADILNGVYFNLSKDGKPELQIKLAGKYLILGANSSSNSSTVRYNIKCTAGSYHYSGRHNDWVVHYHKAVTDPEPNGNKYLSLQMQSGQLRLCNAMGCGKWASIEGAGISEVLSGAKVYGQQCGEDKSDDYLFLQTNKGSLRLYSHGFYSNDIYGSIERYNSYTGKWISLQGNGTTQASYGGKGVKEYCDCTSDGKNRAYHYGGILSVSIQTNNNEIRLCLERLSHSWLCGGWISMQYKVLKAYAIYNINYQLGGTLYSYMVSYPGYSIQKTAVSQVTLNSTSLGIENGYRKTVNATTQAIASLNQLIKGETPAQIESNPYLKYYTFDPFNPVGSLIDARQWSEFGNWIRPFVIETQ